MLSLIQNSFADLLNLIIIMTVIMSTIKGNISIFLVRQKNDKLFFKVILLKVINGRFCLTQSVQDDMERYRIGMRVVN